MPICAQEGAGWPLDGLLRACCHSSILCLEAEAGRRAREDLEEQGPPAALTPLPCTCGAAEATRRHLGFHCPMAPVPPVVNPVGTTTHSATSTTFRDELSLSAQGAALAAGAPISICSILAAEWCGPRLGGWSLGLGGLTWLD